MQMTWENLTKFFPWAAQYGSEAQLADTAGETIEIDCAITKEDLHPFWPLTRSRRHDHRETEGPPAERKVAADGPN